MTYTGIATLNLEDQEMCDFYAGENKWNLYINQYVILNNKDGEFADKGRWTEKGFAKLKYSKIKDFKPKNYKQEFLADLLSDNDTPIRIIAGVPGSGKTAFCIKYGLHFLDKGIFQRMFVLRHNVSVGEKNGFFPGTKIDKIRAWMGFFEDNLDSMQYTLTDMIDLGKLEVDCVESLKGRDIKNAFILVDEAEDLTEEQFKMIGERTSANSVICFVGDYEQVTQDRYKKNNGLIRGIENLKNNNKTGIIVFDDKENDNVRSEVSKIFTYLY